MRLNLKFKIVLPITIFFALVSTVIIVAVGISTTSMVTEFSNEQLDNATTSIISYMNLHEDKTRIAATAIGSSGQIAYFVNGGDRDVIWQYINQRQNEMGVDAIVVTDERGIVIARSNLRDVYGEDVSDVSSVAAGLRGEKLTMYAVTPTQPMVLTSTYPIMENNRVIGSVVVNFEVATNEFIDQIRDIFGVDITVFSGDTSAASTLIHPETGNRATGTPVAPHVADEVLVRGNRMGLDLNVFGMIPFSARYFPLLGESGTPVGIFFVGLSLESQQALAMRQMVIIIIIGLIGILVATLFTYFIGARIAKPIVALKKSAKEIADGKLNTNIDIRSNDEIGVLAEALKDIQSEILKVLDVITERTYEIEHGYFFKGDKTYDIKGDFNQILDVLNKTARGFVNYFDEIPSNVSVMDTDGKFTFINADFQRQGFKIEDTIGKKILDIMNDEVGQRIHKSIQETIQTGSTRCYTVEFTTPLGKNITENHVTAPIKDKKGEIVAVMFYCSDVSNMANAKRISDKINAYQDFESEDIRAQLENTLAVGVLDFHYKPEPADDDTKAAAEAYGKIANTIEYSSDFIKSYIEEINSVLSQLAQGDLTVNISREYKGDFASIKQSINHIVHTLNQTMDGIQTASGQVLAGASSISSSSQELAMGATKQSESIEELNASINMIKAQTDTNAKSAEEASDLSGKSTKNATAGNDSMQHMLTAMNSIKESSEGISAIIKTIQDIAFQTNLLALNASVEAARAGEHGKGFAVVAEEVRLLAGRSKTAAEETTGLIEDSIHRVGTGSGLAEETAKALDVIVHNAQEVLTIINQISESSKAQAEAVEQVSGGIASIASVINNNTAASEETAAASEELNSQALLLKDLVAYFKLK